MKSRAGKTRFAEAAALISPDTCGLTGLRRVRWLVCSAVLCLLTPRMHAAEDVWLHLVGEPFDGGSMTASIHAPESVGEPAFLVLGLGPLPLRDPVPTGIGPFYMSQILQVLGVAPIPADGWLHVPFTMPPIDPQLLGFKAPVQAYVPDRLSNPGMLIFDEPYYGWGAAETVVSPTPSLAAAFGDRIGMGDLNGDGELDLVANAWKESYSGVFFSGRIYVLWGPEFAESITLSPPDPKVGGVLGAGFVLGDVNGDEVTDLIVGDGVGDPLVVG